MSKPIVIDTKSKKNRYLGVKTMSGKTSLKNYKKTYKKKFIFHTK